VLGVASLLWSSSGGVLPRRSPRAPGITRRTRAPPSARRPKETGPGRPWGASSCAAAGDAHLTSVTAGRCGCSSRLPSFFLQGYNSTSRNRRSPRAGVSSPEVVGDALAHHSDHLLHRPATSRCPAFGGRHGHARATAVPHTVLSVARHLHGGTLPFGGFSVVIGPIWFGTDG